LYYTADEPHGLPFDPFKAIIAPRPIGWIGSCDKDGRPNLAPYSFFNAVASRPNMIAFSSEGLKDSPRNVRDTGEFTFSLATLPLAEQMNLSSASLGEGENEFELARLTMAPSRLVRPPFVAESPAALECKLVHFIELLDLSGEPTGRYLSIGQVVATHIKDEYIRDGRFDAVKAQSIARCGYNDYATVEAQWEMVRPR
jgi:flavin reductase (DIM6/NTAB) family NADH-FMN oxidoreductase RutF